jgi:hypothetical protein
MFVVKPNESHMWYFKYAQHPDEPLVFQNLDSVAIEDGIAESVTFGVCG